MKVHALPNAAHLRPQKLSGREVPHATIETNTNCNIRCRSCYAIEHPRVRPLDEVKADIDLAMTRRRLDTLSLIGGEPTLHPQIVDVVRYVKGKGVVCQLLTNGVRFLQGGDLALLDALVSAGVDRFLVHIDSGQKHVHADIEEARHRMCALLDERHVAHGLSITLYPGEEREIPRVLRTYARYRHFDGVLVAVAIDFDRLFAPDAPSSDPSMEALVAAMTDDLHVAPSAYVPSSGGDDEVSWLIYLHFLNTRTGATFALSPELDRLMKRVYRATHEHAFFAETLHPDRVGRSLAAAAVAELLLHPLRLGALRTFLRDLDGTRNLRFQYAVVEHGPRLDARTGKLQICWQCPDAVVRHGKLVPECIAGRLDPLDPGTPSAPRVVIEDLYRHLGEEPPAR